MSDVLHDNQERAWIVAESKLVLSENDKLTFYTPPPIVSSLGDTLMAKATILVVESQWSRKYLALLWICLWKPRHSNLQIRYLKAGPLVLFVLKMGFRDFRKFPIYLSMTFDGKRIWCGAEGGLIRFDPTVFAPAFELITTKESLPSLTCGDIVCDQSKRIWISTHTGLICG